MGIPGPRNHLENLDDEEMPRRQPRNPFCQERMVILSAALFRCRRMTSYCCLYPPGSMQGTELELGWTIEGGGGSVPWND